MARRPEIGNVALYPDRPLTRKDKNGYVLKFYCPLQGKRIRRACGTRDRRVARRVLRECRERLLNGEYAASGGAITEELAEASPKSVVHLAIDPAVERRSWEDCYEEYRRYHKTRVRPRTHDDMVGDLGLCERILESHRTELGIPEGLPVETTMTLRNLEFLQDRLLAGDHGRYDGRSPNTVNSVLAVVMAFVRFCHRREWIGRVPPLRKLEADEVMKGRPVTEDEFRRMLEAVPAVVGDGPAESWRFALRVLWESGFRVGDLMNFSWDDPAAIHPVWPADAKLHPTVVVPSSQKNRRVQEIPLLPGLETLLDEVPESARRGWVVHPMVSERRVGTSDSFRPTKDDLRDLCRSYFNVAIAAACGVSEAAVRKWIANQGLTAPEGSKNSVVPSDLVAACRVRGRAAGGHPALRETQRRLSVDRVGKTIVEIGRRSGVVVSEGDPETGRPAKFASAHDLRRGAAVRLVEAGVSAETLRVVMRHESVATTEAYYGAKRSAQAAARELRRCVSTPGSKLVGGLMGGTECSSDLDPDEVAKLKALLARL